MSEHDSTTAVPACPVWCVTEHGRDHAGYVTSGNGFHHYSDGMAVPTGDDMQRDTAEATVNLELFSPGPDDPHGDEYGVVIGLSAPSNAGFVNLTLLSREEARRLGHALLGTAQLATTVADIPHPDWCRGHLLDASGAPQIHCGNRLETVRSLSNESQVRLELRACVDEAEARGYGPTAIELVADPGDEVEAEPLSIELCDEPAAQLVEYIGELERTAQDDDSLHPLDPEPEP